MLRSFKVKLYPSQEQASRLRKYLSVSRFVYNLALEQRKLIWSQQGRSITLYDQYKELTKCRAENAKLRSVPALVTRDAIRRLDLAYKSAVRRVKSKSKKFGFPRFKSPDRYTSFTTDQCVETVKDGRIKVIGIERSIRCRGLKPIPGKIKQLTVIRKGDKLFARIIYDAATESPLKPIQSVIGIDVGLNKFAYLSDGKSYEAPKPYKTAEKRVRGLSKALSRCKKGSNRRHKAKNRLNAAHNRIASIRTNFIHQLSRKLVNEYDLIAIENLNIAGMRRGRLAKSIQDVSWGYFLHCLTYKAEDAGKLVVKVDPKNTSQECSSCGQIVKKDLSVRVHKCPCGTTLDRDHNSAKVILARALKQAKDLTPPQGTGGVRHTEEYKTKQLAALLKCVGGQ